MYTTSVSLLERLHSPNDRSAWERFVKRRTPLMYVWSLRLGLQESDAAIDDLAKNVAMLEAALACEPNHATLRDRLDRTHGVRANLLDGQGRFAESAADRRHTVALSPSPQQANFHSLELALALARAGQSDLAVNELEDFEAAIPGTEAWDVVGPVCESGDFFAKDRHLPAMKRGDLLSTFSAGAYGMVMSSNYNTRPRAAEVLVDGGEYKLVRRRETLDDLLAPELEVS